MPRRQWRWVGWFRPFLTIKLVSMATSLSDRKRRVRSVIYDQIFVLWWKLLKISPVVPEIICLKGLSADDHQLTRAKIVTRPTLNKYACPPNTWMEMYAGRIAFCPLVSHVEYVPRALWRLKKTPLTAVLIFEKDRTGRRTDWCRTKTILFSLDAASAIMAVCQLIWAAERHCHSSFSHAGSM